MTDSGSFLVCGTSHPGIFFTLIHSAMSIFCKRTLKALMILHECAAWSWHLLSAKTCFFFVFFFFFFLFFFFFVFCLFFFFFFFFFFLHGAAHISTETHELVILFLNYDAVKRFNSSDTIPLVLVHMLFWDVISCHSDIIVCLWKALFSDCGLSKAFHIYFRKKCIGRNMKYHWA